MPLGAVIAIYFVVWWVILFAVLPWGVRTQDDEGEVTLGTVGSAPARPRLVRVAVITTIVAAVITAGIWYAFAVYGLDFASFATWFDFRQ
jgi:predicted secreted protein